ncbi:translation initiation factor IF-2-like [Orcinus orca]|uniref:translation initiation factor IF-2-like n=1 Tax=Orcinus orca TaxID=9733 RepID=UPI00062B92CA|nr:translation initiation factor IF-2-like [Orcinus orca]
MVTGGPPLGDTQCTCGAPEDRARDTEPKGLAWRPARRRPRLTCAPARPARTAGPPPGPALAAPAALTAHWHDCPRGRGRGGGGGGGWGRGTWLARRMGSVRGGCGSGCGRRTPDRAAHAPPRARPSARHSLPLAARAGPRSAPPRLAERPARQRPRPGGASGSCAEGGSRPAGPRGPRPEGLAPLGTGSGGDNFSGNCQDSPGNRRDSRDDRDPAAKRVRGRVWTGAGSPMSDSSPCAAPRAQRRAPGHLHGAHSCAHAPLGRPCAVPRSTPFPQLRQALQTTRPPSFPKARSPALQELTLRPKRALASGTTRHGRLPPEKGGRESPPQTTFAEADTWPACAPPSRPRLTSPAGLPAPGALPRAPQPRGRENNPKSKRAPGEGGRPGPSPRGWGTGADPSEPKASSPGVGGGSIFLGDLVLGSSFEA